MAENQIQWKENNSIDYDNAVDEIRVTLKQKSSMSYRVDLDLWGDHPSRNQRQRKTRGFFVGNKDEVVNVVYEQLDKEYGDDISYFYAQQIGFYTPYALQKRIKDTKIKELKETIQNQNYKVSYLNAKIDKLNIKISKIKHKLEISKWFVRYRKWKLKRKNNKLSERQKDLKTCTKTIEKCKLSIKKLSNEIEDILEKRNNIHKRSLNNHSLKLNFIGIEKFLQDHDKALNQKGEKGVYIIWNKTKDKYYVGQSKDIDTRICCQHWKKGICLNKNFMDDFNVDRDEFFIAFVFSETKDELDNLEQMYIHMCDSFFNGYNSTAGNK